MFPSYIFAVGGAGKRTALGMFGYNYDREVLDEDHFKWLVTKLIKTNGNYRVYIIDSETANKEKDYKIADYLSKKANELKLELSREGYRGDIIFISINLEPPHGYSYECIGGVKAIDDLREFIRNNGGKYYWLNASREGKYDYGDVDPEIYNRVMTILGNNIISIQNGVNRNRAITKSLWVYYQKLGGSLPELVNENIAILGGLGGGTGSALIVELARRYYGRNRVYIFGFLPACEGESSLSYSCGYITLSELEKLSMDDPNFRSSVYVFLVPLNFVSPQTGIAYTGETQDIELRKFPKALLYTILAYFRMAHGAGQTPVDVTDNRKIVRPFILASTYLVNVFGSKQIESAFGEALKNLETSLNYINSILANFEEDVTDPPLEIYIDLISKFNNEFDLIIYVIDLYKKIGIFNTQLNDLINSLVDDYISLLRSGFSEVENLVSKYGLSNELEEHLIKNNIGFYSLIKANTEDIYRKFENYSLSGSSIDMLFFDVIKAWIKNLYEIAMKSVNIYNYFKEFVDGDPFAILFLSSDDEKLDELVKSLHLQRNKLNKDLQNLENLIRTLSSVKRDIIADLKNSSELSECIRKFSELSADKEIFEDESVISNFKSYLDKFIQYLMNLKISDFEEFENNFRGLVVEIESKIKSEQPEYSVYIERFKDMLKVAEKYDKLVAENKLYTQLVKLVSYRYNLLKCKKILSKIFGKEYCEKKDKLKNDLDNELRESFSIVRVDRNEYCQPTIAVRGTPLVDYILSILDDKRLELEQRISDLLNKICSSKSDLLETIGVSIDRINVDLSKFKSFDDLLKSVENIFEMKIRDLEERKETVSSKIKTIENIRSFISELRSYKSLVFSDFKHVENMIGSLVVETCEQNQLAKVQYTLGISKHGDFGYLLTHDRDVMNDVNNYIERQIDCFIQRSNLFLGYKKIPIHSRGVSISFDKVFVLIGVPENVPSDVIDSKRLYQLISRRFYPGGANILNYAPGNISVDVYDCTTQDTLTITLILVGTCLDNISWVDKYYECFRNGGQDVGFDQVGDAIYIRYVYNLEMGYFFVRNIIDERYLGDTYVDENYENILSKLSSVYTKRTFLREDLRED